MPRSACLELLGDGTDVTSFDRANRVVAPLCGRARVPFHGDCSRPESQLARGVSLYRSDATRGVPATCEMRSLSPRCVVPLKRPRARDISGTFVGGVCLLSRRTRDSVRIATWNVNSLKARLEKVTWWLDRARPDVLLMQETKLADGDAPSDTFRSAGYELAHHGEGRWNGVAIASRAGVTGV